MSTILETENLTKRFGSLTANGDVNLTVESGTTHSVIGPNGAGKSTLFNLITGLLEPTSGSIRFNGEDITGESPHEVARRGLARSFQITDVFDGLTAFENVRVAAQFADDRRSSMWRSADSLTDAGGRATEILEDVGLADRSHQRAAEFAYGDRRKLEIGITMATEPDLLMLDEPTAGMGREDTISTVQLVQRLADERGFTLMLIEHDIEIVMSISDTITVLQRGEVIAEGTPDEVRADEEVQRAYLGGAQL
ncbi:ABC transporter ATP-binding protein [Halogeometricum limi]|uniref:Probable branched-chain amino acid transport ATP-binding protein LivG n=1 Tax=Halogeometricum limi TaxID=555875 RepID=A0A1I6IC81_9EURY|nr:ABC transporter ATP-binding protein [Halogeometricum limi]SFR63980.1 branched-chain amino acid transport system ATP-binding protein [Halogeometricum limi]